MMSATPLERLYALHREAERKQGEAIRESRKAREIADYWQSYSWGLQAAVRGKVLDGNEDVVAYMDGFKVGMEILGKPL